MVLDIPNGLFGQDDVRETPVGEIGTKYLSINPASWRSSAPDVDDVSVWSHSVGPNVNAIGFWAPVNLPHGAVIMEVIVYGSVSDETWFLKEVDINAAVTNDIATANLNTGDTTITNPIVNNLIYSYALTTSSLDNGDRIYGGLITYTV